MPLILRRPMCAFHLGPLTFTLFGEGQWWSIPPRSYRDRHGRWFAIWIGTRLRIGRALEDLSWGGEMGA